MHNKYESAGNWPYSQSVRNLVCESLLGIEDEVNKQRRFKEGLKTTAAVSHCWASTDQHHSEPTWWWWWRCKNAPQLRHVLWFLSMCYQYIHYYIMCPLYQVPLEDEKRQQLVWSQKICGARRYTEAISMLYFSCWAHILISSPRSQQMDRPENWSMDIWLEEMEVNKDLHTVSAGWSTPCSQHCLAAFHFTMLFSRFSTSSPCRWLRSTIICTLASLVWLRLHYLVPFLLMCKNINFLTYLLTYSVHPSIRPSVSLSRLVTHFL